MERADVVQIDNDAVRREYGSLGPFVRDDNIKLIHQFRTLCMNFHLAKLDLVILSLKLLSATVAP